MTQNEVSINVNAPNHDIVNHFIQRLIQILEESFSLQNRKMNEYQMPKQVEQKVQDVSYVV